MLTNEKTIEVTELITKLNHPLIQGIEILRELILAVDLELKETIKWNGPNYQFNNEDRITLRVQDLKQIQIIFHRGAIVKVQPINHLIDDEFNLLIWKENDRAIISFKTIDEIKTNKESIQILVYRWLLASND